MRSWLQGPETTGSVTNTVAGDNKREVDEATAGIGRRLAGMRAARELRVGDLARGVGVSSSLISQIERGQSKPSVGTLFALARVLRVPVDTFFQDSEFNFDSQPEDGAAGQVANPRAEEPDAPPMPVVDPLQRPPWGEGPGRRAFVVRIGERASIDIRGGVRWERLTPTALDGVEFLELVYAPGAESDAQLYRHPGIELVVVTEGAMTIFLGFDRHDLAVGDSIAFPSSTPHRYINGTERESRAVSVILRDDLSTMTISP